jgi:hypothetical protein
MVSRLVGMIGATATASVALLLLSRNQFTTLGLIALLMLLCGSIVYLSGLALWCERPGFALRLIGWVLVVAALTIPSTLTLLLPLAALLALTLTTASADRTLAAPHTRQTLALENHGMHPIIRASFREARQRRACGRRSGSGAYVPLDRLSGAGEALDRVEGATHLILV